MSKKTIDFTCVYKKTLYRNKDNGNTVFTVVSKTFDECKNNRGEIICKGKIPVYVNGVPLKITGTITNENKVEVKTIKEYSDDKKITLNYLSSGLFKGIGEKTAEKIVNITGPDIFSFLESNKNPGILLAEKIKNFTAEKAEVFIKELMLNKERVALYKELITLGCNFGQCDALFDAYGLDALSRLKKQPYEAGYIGGLPFPTRDLIAKKLGFSAFSSERINAICYECLKDITNAGNSYGTIDDVEKSIKYIVKTSAFTDNIPTVLIITAMTSLKGIYISNANINNEYRFYLSKIYKAEKNISSQIKRIIQTGSNLPYSFEQLKVVEDNLGIKYSKSQENCFNLLKTSGIKIITGGPGTGKSTVIKGLVQAYKKMLPNGKISLCAPTGRAAQRITETTGERASTIHHLLDYNFVNGVASFKNAENPIDADFIVIDEASMVDTEIFSLLLSAVKNNTLIILCGDVNQLPSVSSGNVLNDLIKSSLIDVIELDVTYRQETDSPIISNATNILKGNDDFVLNSSFIIKKENNDTILSAISKIAKKYNCSKDIYNVQFLSSTKKGNFGTKALNKYLQPILNHQYISLDDDYSGIVPGDKVMTVNNNYNAGYFNGDIGKVKTVDEDGIVIDINGKDILIKNKNLKDVVLSYVCTIHKAQGSEFNTVVIILPESASNMLDKKLLYTAVTRAKKNVIIISEGESVNIAIHTKSTNYRKTSLCEFLRGDFY